ncbi:MAG: hypothetical protein GY909_18015 [Oligoflexia bacterium]|nr:hypothetical protein [Oligoflexia bacterium]
MNLIGNDIYVFYGLLVVIIFQRLFEMDLSKRNEERLSQNYGARIVKSKESKLLKVFHTVWFLSLFIEGWFFGKTAPKEILIMCYFIVLVAQGLRFFSMRELGAYWTINIMMIKNQVRINSGIIKYLKHPAYIAVVLEFIFIPLTYSCYFTLIFFSILNIFIISKRINLEEKLLSRLCA